MTGRCCEACGRPLDERRRSNAKTCEGSRCRTRTYRQRQRHVDREQLLEEWAASGAVHRMHDGTVSLRVRAPRLHPPSAAIACRRAGAAFRLPAHETARELLHLALDVASGLPRNELDRFLDETEDQLRVLQRARRRGLVALEQHLAAKPGSAEWLSDQMRNAA